MIIKVKKEIKSFLGTAELFHTAVETINAKELTSKKQTLKLLKEYYQAHLGMGVTERTIQNIISGWFEQGFLVLVEPNKEIKVETFLPKGKGETQSQEAYNEMSLNILVDENERLRRKLELAESFLTPAKKKLYNQEKNNI